MFFVFLSSLFISLTFGHPLRLPENILVQSHNVETNHEPEVSARATTDVSDKQVIARFGSTHPAKVKTANVDTEHFDSSEQVCPSIAPPTIFFDYAQSFVVSDKIIVTIC